MPVPVYLLFSSSLLQEQGVKFSPGRLTKKSQLGQSARVLADMDFKAIFHDRSVGVQGTHGRSDVLFSRLAEVLVQDRLSFDHLKFIVCRSEPERDPLLLLLNETARKKWIRKVVVDEGHRRLFFKQTTFVKSVYLSQHEARFAFYHDIAQDMRGPFNFRVEWTSRGQSWARHYLDFMIQSQPEVIPVPRGANPGNYGIRLTLDGETAYIGRFDLRTVDLI